MALGRSGSQVKIEGGELPFKSLPAAKQAVRDLAIRAALVLGAEREISWLQIRKIAQYDQRMRRSPQKEPASQRRSGHIPLAGYTWTRRASSPVAPAKSSKKNQRFAPLSPGDLCRNASWREICADRHRESNSIFNFVARLEVELRIRRSGIPPRFLP